MRVVVQLFAGLRDRLQCGHIILDVPERCPVGEILPRLFEDPGEASQWQRAVLLAVNRCYTTPDTALQEGDEIALIPPVAGG